MTELKEYHMVTISHGTVKPDDVFEAIETYLTNTYSNLSPRARDAATALCEDYQTESYHDIKNEILGELYDLMNEIACDGYYFGSAEGDPTLIGFFKEKEC